MPVSCNVLPGLFMDNTQQHLAVLFADITGSTSIYERFGDARANAIIHAAVSRMTEISLKHDGTLIKTIGDEIMCHFPNASMAVEAACEINEEFDVNPPSKEVDLTVKIGLHYGPALVKSDGDLFGDMVNVAARMTGIAHARQIITTPEVVANLNADLQTKCREFDRTYVKGKSEPIVIYEVVWEPQDVTTISPRMQTTTPVTNILPLEIAFNDQRYLVTESGRPLLMGRGEQCDLVVPSSLASRSHAAIQFSRGKYILTDQSTNGTYVQLASGKQFYLRRESCPIAESGMICLGENFSPNSSNVIYFRLPPSA